MTFSSFCVSFQTASRCFLMFSWENSISTHTFSTIAVVFITLFTDACSLTENLSSSCDEINNLSTNSNRNGIYYIQDNNNFMYPVYCDMNIDGGGWTLVATVHENNILDNSGRCKIGDKWSSENGNQVGSQNGAEAWFNYATFGNVVSATSEDYKNPAYFGLQARDVMIWQVPNDTPLHQFDFTAYLKFRTNTGFLADYGGNMFYLYNDYFPIKSGVYNAVSDNGPNIPVVFEKGSAAELQGYYGSNVRTEAGYIEVTIVTGIGAGEGSRRATADPFGSYSSKSVNEDIF